MKEKYYNDRSPFLSILIILFLTGIIIGCSYLLGDLVDLELAVAEQRIVPNEFEVKLLITSGALRGFFITMIIIGVVFIYLEIVRIIPMNIKFLCIRFVNEFSIREFLLRLTLFIASILVIICVINFTTVTINTDLSQMVQNWDLDTAFYIHNVTKEFYIVGITGAMALAIICNNILNIKRCSDYFSYYRNCNE